MPGHTLVLAKNKAVTCIFLQDECVAFHEQKGQTHLLNEMGAELFSIISKQPIARPQFLAHLTDTFEWPETLRPDLLLHELIEEYQNLGLLDVTEHPKT